MGLGNNTQTVLGLTDIRYFCYCTSSVTQELYDTNIYFV